MSALSSPETEPWGPYASYNDIARFEYGRRMWQRPAMRARLLDHWMDVRHPHRERFVAQRESIEELLASQETPGAIDRALRARGSSLRALSREIPPVFGEFFTPAAR